MRKPRAQASAEGGNWSTFLVKDPADLETKTHKQLVAVAKKARVGANGTTAALRERLRDLVASATPPEWYVQEGAAAAARRALVVELKGAQKVAQMQVGQRIEVPRTWRKLGGSDSHAEGAAPEGCVEEVLRSRTTTAVHSTTTQKRQFTARAPGSFTIVYTTWTMSSMRATPTRRVLVTIKA